jgi:glycerol-3-phosphate dehydrogenase
MKRETVLDQIENNRAPWDFLVIGGGSTGLGVAVDAAARGYRTLLVEQHDFAMPVVSLVKEDEHAFKNRRADCG